MAKRKDETREEYNARQRERAKRTQFQRNAYMRKWRAQRQEAGLPTSYRDGEAFAQKPWEEYVQGIRADRESRGYIGFVQRTGKRAGKFRWRHPSRAYGLTPQHVEAMLLSQCGRCAICGEVMDSPQIDHNHRTGEVRGLLCGNCNRRLGYFENRWTAFCAYVGLVSGGQPA